MVILPSHLSDINTELSTMNVSQLASYHNFTAKDVELELPKFTVKADTDLAPVFTNVSILHSFYFRLFFCRVGKSEIARLAKPKRCFFYT